eukprot:maker-scaffold988_size73003-snap-gene-0.15 protein:Tk02479 transcript:maker-scaffold988_size73003-snap-gene-0.15-mRNA-1 annotation:"sequestosome-1 isoform x1"
MIESSTFDSLQTFKVYFDPSGIRKFCLSTPVRFQDLQDAIIRSDKESNFVNNWEQVSLNYKDSDGDMICLTGDEDVQEMMRDKESVCRVHVESASRKVFTGLCANSMGELHPNSVCMCCHTQINGFRYKCAVCADFDLCGRCETKANHPGHDMIRISQPQRQYPPHFFTRIHRLYERLNQGSPITFRSPTNSTPGLEPMARDLIDDELDSPDISALMLDEKHHCDDIKEASLPTIEELTKHMQNLADQDDPTECLDEPQLRKNYYNCDKLMILDNIVKLEPSHPEVIALMIEPIQVTEQKAKIPSQRVKESGMEYDSIQDLQEEIDKLLEPLSKEPGRSSQERRASFSKSSSSSVSSSPFELCEIPQRQIIIEKAIVEDNGKREREGYSSEEEFKATPPKNARKSSNERPNSRQQMLFDEITVAEVTEEVCEDTLDDLEEVADDDEYEYEYEDEEDETPQASPVTTIEVPAPIESTIRSSSSRATGEEATKYTDSRSSLNEADKFLFSTSRMELRRALHRAGIDSTIFNENQGANSSSTLAISSPSASQPSPSASAKPGYEPVWKGISTSVTPRDNSKTYSSTSYGDYGLYKPGTTVSSKVSDARDQMLSMGFSDDDGWLTQLLTMKRGNIDEVLDILAPVAKS